MKEYGYTLRRKLPYESFDYVFLKIKMKGLELMNEIGIYLSFDRRMIFVSESYRVQDFFDEFLEYEVRYVFNVTVMCFWI